MPTLFEFTCKAARFQFGNLACEKGETIVCTEDDPRLATLRRHRVAFSEKALPRPAAALPTAAKLADQGLGGEAEKPGGGEPTLEDILTPAQVASLRGAGYENLVDFLAATPEELRAVKGIGEGTLAKLAKLQDSNDG